jgi:hypothetical protein
MMRAHLVSETARRTFGRRGRRPQFVSLPQPTRERREARVARFTRGTLEVLSPVGPLGDNRVRYETTDAEVEASQPPVN